MFELSKIWLMLLLMVFPLFLSGQNGKAFEQDSVAVYTPDTVSLSGVKMIDIKPVKTTDKQLEGYRPDPLRAIWLGAVIPGYGQIINRKYWKLPIVYGGFLGCFYAVSWNSGRFIAYKNAYLDITDGDDRTNSFLEIIPPGYTLDSYGGKSAFTNLLKSGMDKARYNRDLSIIVTIAYYGLTLIDAFVDAHLYDFDISPELSLKLRPAILEDRFTTNRLPKSALSYGLTGSIKF